VKAKSLKKVLVIGSGPIIIGQAAEFDYAGTQACKALREEGVTSVLVNSNPATIMTDEGIADIVYIEPLTVEVVARVIEKERPDGLLPTLGGQTGLNLAVELADQGILDKFNVRLLGTSLEAIKKAEDRELFKKMLAEIDEPVPESVTVSSLDEAHAFAEKVGLPLIIRPAYTLGGTGGGIAHNQAQFDSIVSSGLAASRIHQVLLERCVIGWKEVEYEVMRDGADNCITVCNMENLDPMGVHTGDSIVIAPSQTLSDKEYQMLRTASIKIIRALKIEGGCNIQFALSPTGEGEKTSGICPYYVIEVNPRVSRSSALASKATGYPIARVAAKIAVGRRLDEITNAVTGKTLAAFEPTLDYVVIKIPRWPFDKFPTADRTIGTQMKSTGEVMTIDRTFEAAFQKAVRGLEIGGRSLLWEDSHWGDEEEAFPLSFKLSPSLVNQPNDLRLWAIFALLRRGRTTSEIAQRSGVDPWFLEKFKNIVEMEALLKFEDLTSDLLRKAKRFGFSDNQIAQLTRRTPEDVTALREKWNIFPVYKMVDTCAAEFPAATPYFYSTYEVENEAGALEGNKAVVIGSGPIRIGQGIEFDYCCVQSAWALQEAGYQSIMINSNPETVSTDFDTSSRLYFESLDEESVYEVIRNENGAARTPHPKAASSSVTQGFSLDKSISTPVILQFGGQTPINLAEPLGKRGVAILGTSVESIDLAEDRRLFEAFLGRLGIPQPPGAAALKIEEALFIAEQIGYPVLVRPSYVLGGRAMEIVYTPEDLRRYIAVALALWERHPVLIDKYLAGKEVEVDALGDGEQVLIPGIMEHIERAGVHSGDSFAVYPARLGAPEVEQLLDYTTRITLALGVRGLVNIQFVIFQGRVFVLEVNPRGSRTVPFISKVTGVPMVKLATGIVLGKSLADQGYSGGLWPAPGLVAVKAPVFSMSKLLDVDTYLGPEMKSTGEVMGVDTEFAPALYKALLASGLSLPRRGEILVTVADKDKEEALPIVEQMASLGYVIHATEGTSRLLSEAGLKVNLVNKLGEESPNVLDLIQLERINGVINTLEPGKFPARDGFYMRRAAVEHNIPCFTSLDTARAVVESLASANGAYSVKPLREYVKRVAGGTL